VAFQNFDTCLGWSRGGLRVRAIEKRNKRNNQKQKMQKKMQKNHQKNHLLIVINTSAIFLQ
jgi:hypothetical protein